MAAFTRPASELRDLMGISADEIDRRKRYLQFDKADEARLAEINDLARAYAVPVIEAFYQRLLKFPDTKA